MIDIDVIIKVVKSGGNILDLARALEISIAEASALVSELSSQHDTLKRVFRDWPKNIEAGYVYVEENTPQLASVETRDENGNLTRNKDGDLVRGKLKTGQYVLATKLHRKSS